MPDLAERATYERALAADVREVFGRFRDRNRFDADRFGREIAAATLPTVKEIRQRALIAMLILIADDDQAIAELLKRNQRSIDAGAAAQSERLGRDMSATSRGWLADSDDFARTLEDRVLAPSRADTVGVTETTTAVSEAEAEGQDILEGIGIDTEPRWITQLDERVCPVCGPMHNRPRSRWGSMGPPPAHPNCRCFLVYAATVATR